MGGGPPMFFIIVLLYIMKNNKDSNFIKVLKKYTDINIRFIYDFFSNFNPIDFDNETENEFTIEDIKVAKWLGINVLTIRERLRNKYSVKKNNYYVENVDYIRIKNGKFVKYYITYKCFESLAMRSESIKGEEVRGYFIKLREFIQYNQNLIYQAMFKQEYLKELNKLIKSKRKEFIYVIAIDEKYENIFKIGRTNDIIRRLSTYNVGRINEVILKYLAIVRDSKVIEKCMKYNLKKFQIMKNKEIYKVSIRFLEKVIDKCNCDEEELCGLIKYLKNRNDVKPYIIFY